ncbi:MAG: alpha/beta hydrolase [Undibacterium sp.]|uniref:alpha/beta fold hydrolase n=1 Tax=Undibacterium sp. TaxID=1914977 RepID=UPI0027231101|nr:alpha/beta hydrolase [Undibacterium sp.]MDO8651017.1 alpha/beta hydrolase [Undibacterium sp.]
MLTLVLMPGMDGTGYLFESFISALGGEFAVTTVCYPKNETLGYDDLEVIARRLLPTSGNFIILGESFSGPIAVSLAAAKPKGLVGLILCSTFVRNPRPAFKPMRMLAHVLPVKLAPNIIINYFLLAPFSTSFLRSALKSAISQVSGPAFKARLNAVLSVDVSAKLRAVQVPLLYLQAAHDRVVPPDAGSYIAAVYPATQVLTIDAPHFLLQVAPDEAANAVKSFARDILRKRIT